MHNKRFGDHYSNKYNTTWATNSSFSFWTREIIIHSKKYLFSTIWRWSNNWSNFNDQTLTQIMPTYIKIIELQIQRIERIHVENLAYFASQSFVGVFLKQKLMITCLCCNVLRTKHVYLEKNAFWAFSRVGILNHNDSSWAYCSVLKVKFKFHNLNLF